VKEFEEDAEGVKSIGLIAGRVSKRDIGFSGVSRDLTVFFEVSSVTLEDSVRLRGRFRLEFG
jgi:hypothetical protein